MLFAKESQYRRRNDFTAFFLYALKACSSCSSVSYHDHSTSVIYQKISRGCMFAFSQTWHASRIMSPLPSSRSQNLLFFYLRLSPPRLRYTHYLPKRIRYELMSESFQSSSRSCNVCPLLQCRNQPATILTSKFVL
jgi:hypothetical protein